MTELKAGTRGTWGVRKEPCVVVAPEVDSSGQFIVRNDWNGGYEAVYAEDFTPDPEPPTTVMVEMRVEDARLMATNDFIFDQIDRETLTRAAVEALKKAGLG